MTLGPHRTHNFKMRLTPGEAERIKNRAGDHRLSQADYVRILVFGQATEYGLPSAPSLRKIAQQLTGIGNNLNQCQRSINEAQARGTLSAEQFAAMHRAISQGREAWAEPLSELRGQLNKLRPRPL